MSIDVSPVKYSDSDFGKLRSVSGVDLEGASGVRLNPTLTQNIVSMGNLG